MVRKNISKIIEEAVIEGIKNNAEEIFNQSQLNVPVITGELKRSGKIEETDKGSKIEYTVKYAHPVEFGREEQDLSEEEHEVYVRPYTRKNGIRVKGYYKKYNGRIINLQSKDSGEIITRTITKVGASSPRLFLTNATLEVIPEFIEDLADSLETVDWGQGVRVNITLERGI